MAKRKCNILWYLALVIFIYALIDFWSSCHCVDKVYLGREVSDEIGLEIVEELNYTNNDLSKSVDKHCETLPAYPRLDIEDDEFSCAKAVRGQWQHKSFSKQPVDDLNSLLQQNCTEFTKNRHYLTQVRIESIEHSTKNQKAPVNEEVSFPLAYSIVAHKNPGTVFTKL